MPVSVVPRNATPRRCRGLERPPAAAFVQWGGRAYFTSTTGVYTKLLVDSPDGITPETTIGQG